MKRNDKEGRTSNAYAARGRRRGGIAAQNKKRRKGRLAAHRGPNLWRLLLFLIGAIAMRGAGCTYNDILDRKLDAQVERTRNRPLPSRRVTVRAAVAFVAQALVGRRGRRGWRFPRIFANALWGGGGRGMSRNAAAKRFGVSIASAVR